MRIVPQWAVAELCGTRAGLSRAPLCSSVLDDRNGRPAHSFRSIRRQRNQAVTKRALNHDSHLPRRVALTKLTSTSASTATVSPFRCASRTRLWKGGRNERIDSPTSTVAHDARGTYVPGINRYPCDRNGP